MHGEEKHRLSPLHQCADRFEAYPHTTYELTDTRVDILGHCSNESIHTYRKCMLSYLKPLVHVWLDLLVPQGEKNGEE